MVIFQMSGKSTPSTTYIMEKIEKLTSDDIIGTGGYGTVYRLVLDDETVLAVKKLSRGGIDRERGFERELETLSDLKHKNLVSLRGYYSAPHINILLYDLMGNGGLDAWLHGALLSHTSESCIDKLGCSLVTRCSYACVQNMNQRGSIH